MDENVQYLVLALYWFTQVRLHPLPLSPDRLNSKPNQLDLNSIVIIIKPLDRNRSFSLYSLSPLFLSFTLVSFSFQKNQKTGTTKLMTFYLFPNKLVTFIRTSLLPKPAPVVASTTNGSTPTVPLQSLGQKSSRFIQVRSLPLPPPHTLLSRDEGLKEREKIWVKANYEQAMQFVSYIEVILVFSRLLFGALLFRNSFVPPPSSSPLSLIQKLRVWENRNRFLAPLIFAHFLRLRFYLSPPTRLVFALVTKNLDAGLEHKSCPAGIKSTVKLLRSLVRSPFFFR